MQISSNLVANALEHLRENAVRKLSGNKQFKTSGIATIKVKLVGSSLGSTKFLNLEMGLSVTGETLMVKILNEIRLGSKKCRNIKLICHGKILSCNGRLLTIVWSK